MFDGSESVEEEEEGSSSFIKTWGVREEKNVDGLFRLRFPFPFP